MTKRVPYYPEATGQPSLSLRRSMLFFIPVYLPMHLSLTHLTYRIHLICRIYRTLLCLLPSYPILSYPILSHPFPTFLSTPLM